MTIREINGLDPQRLREALHSCCGSSAWVEKMMTVFPVADKRTLFEKAAQAWQSCGPEDGLEAFSCHPRIGARTTDATAASEQSGAGNAARTTLEALAAGNRAYEEKFGYIYIVCATGKSAGEMLDLLNRRLGNTPGQEMRIAMEEQGKITRIRLEKLLA